MVDREACDWMIVDTDRPLDSGPAASPWTTAGRYFLLGVAASAIAFAFHETANRHLSLSLYFAGAAVIVWALGFAAGVVSLSLHRQTISSNLNLIFMQRFARGLSAETTEPLLADVEARMKKIAARESHYGRGLEWSLPIGAIAYAAGHVLHLVGR